MSLPGDVGFYQALEKQTTCSACPADRTTRLLAATGEQEPRRQAVRIRTEAARERRWFFACSGDAVVEGLDPKCAKSETPGLALLSWYRLSLYSGFRGEKWHWHPKVS